MFNYQYCWLQKINKTWKKNWNRKTWKINYFLNSQMSATMGQFGYLDSSIWQYMAVYMNGKTTAEHDEL